MTFIYPLGFLALLAIPALIFIYIIKNRYTEQTVSSTYLWTLSEKFLRRRIPINKITGLLSLILQILAVCLIAIIVAHPVLSIPGGARQYCFILDGSGSMNIEQGGSTRFEEAKKKIADIIDDSMTGSTYTIIYAGDTSAIWLQDSTNKKTALSVLDDLEVGYSDTSFSGALTLAQRYFSENPSSLTYLVTDKTYTETQNVNVINVLTGTQNYGISDVEYQYTGDGIQITGNVTSYASDAEITVEFYFAGSEYNTSDDGSYELFDSIKVEVEEGVETAFAYDCDVLTFSSFKARIAEKDSLAMDNEVIVYNLMHENISKTLVIYGPLSDGKYEEPAFLKSALQAAGNNQLEFTTDQRYASADYSGYGLYVFNNCTPDEVPREGVVWFINPQSTVKGSRFSYQDTISASGVMASYNGDSNTQIQQMLEGLSKRDFGLAKYARLSIPSTFKTYIECNGNPLLFTGDNEYDNREVVFAFDLSDSATFTFSYDCTTLISRLLSYSFPEIVNATTFYCGETLQINKISGCTGMRIDTPLGNSEYPDISTSYTEYPLTEVGVYTVHLTMKDGEDRTVNIYSAIPLAERQLKVEETSFVLVGTPGDDKLPGIIDNLLVIFIILAVIAVADFGVYCYEQYQLR